VRAVLFELDNTLISRRGGYLGELASSLATYLPRFPPLDGVAVRTLKLLPDVRPVLGALTRSRTPFGIVTNGLGYKRTAIRALGLEQMASCFVSHPFGARKPSPRIFLAAAACLGMPAEHVLFVGDALHADIAGAHRCGMRTAWVRHRPAGPGTVPPAGADARIDALADLLSLLELAPA
jgi:putative hydrolase of the HAD superfamily